MTFDSHFLKRILRSLRRVYPRCSMISQAIAFNLFLAFFPTLLFAVGFASGWLGTKAATMDAIKDFIDFLPPGSHSIVSESQAAAAPTFGSTPFSAGRGRSLSAPR